MHNTINPYHLIANYSFIILFQVDLNCDGGTTETDCTGQNWYSFDLSGKVAYSVRFECLEKCGGANDEAGVREISLLGLPNSVSLIYSGQIIVIKHFTIRGS